MPDRKMTEAYTLNPLTAEGTDVVSVGRPGNPGLVGGVTLQDIANLAPIGSTPGTRVGAALTGNGSTNVLATLQASVNAVPIGGTWILDPGTAGEDHFVNDTLIIPANINVDMRGRVVASFTDRPIIYVNNTDLQNGANGKGVQLKLKARGLSSSAALRSSSNEEWVAIRLRNLQNATVITQTNNTHIGVQMYATDACFGNFIYSYHSLDHRIHLECRCVGDSADPNATPGSSTGGSYINANKFLWNRADNTSNINGSPDADSVAIRYHGTHGGYDRSHGNRHEVTLLQLQNSTTARRRGIYIDAGARNARGNEFCFTYFETGNQHIGEIHPSAGALDNTIIVGDWVPGNQDNPEMLIDWTGGSSGFGGLNWVYGGSAGLMQSRTHIGREFRPGWSSGRLVDKVNYYSDTQIQLDGVFHKTSGQGLLTYTDKPLTANVVPGFDALRIVTGGLFFWLNTENAKAFQFWRDCVPGFSGRVWLVPCDGQRRTIGANSNIVGGPDMTTQGNTNYTGASNSAIASSVDNSLDAPVRFKVSAATKWVLCGIVVGTNHAHVRELHISPMSGIYVAPTHVCAGPHDFGLQKTRVANKAPALSHGGRFRAGDILQNDGTVTDRSVVSQWVAPSNQIIAPTWTQSNSVFVGDLRTGTAAAGAAGNVYRCIVAGTTASSGNGPTGTSTTTPVVSGSSQWLYAGPAFSAWGAET